MAGKQKGQEDEGTPIFHSDSVEMRGNLPVELYQEVLICGAALGMKKSDILGYALQRLVSDAGIQELKANFIKRKAEEYGIAEHEVYARVLQVYDTASRKRRANLESD